MEILQDTNIKKSFERTKEVSTGGKVMKTN